MMVVIDNPTDLNAVVTRAKVVEAGRFYSDKDPGETSKPKLENDVEKLAKQFEQMTLNFSKVLAALAGNNTTKPTNNYNPSRIMRRDKSPS